MRALIQRVSEASVEVDGEVKGSIGAGLLILLGVRTGDTVEEAKYLAGKCANLRAFTDEDGKFNLSALDVGAEILIVSQFTLYGDTRKGRRPSFIDAARPEQSEPLYEDFVFWVRSHGLQADTGVFGATMKVHLINDGPVTFIVEKENQDS